MTARAYLPQKRDARNTEVPRTSAPAPRGESHASRANAKHSTGAATRATEQQPEPRIARYGSLTFLGEVIGFVTAAHPGVSPALSDAEQRHVDIAWREYFSAEQVAQQILRARARRVAS